MQCNTLHMLCTQSGSCSPDTVPVLRLRAAAARRRVLRSARHRGRPPHRRGHRSLALRPGVSRRSSPACFLFPPRSRIGALSRILSCVRSIARQVPRQPWDLDTGAGGGLEAGRRRRARQGRGVLLPDMAHRQSLQLPYAISSPIGDAASLLNRLCCLLLIECVVVVCVSVRVPAERAGPRFQHRQAHRAGEKRGRPVGDNLPRAEAAGG